MTPIPPRICKTCRIPLHPSTHPTSINCKRCRERAKREAKKVAERQRRFEERA